MPNSAGKAGPGIDVRGAGGYILAPSSQHISGRPYAISVDHHPHDVQLADLPAWLLSRLLAEPAATKPPAKPARDWRSTVSAVIAEGERNRTLASLSGHPAAQPDRSLGNPRPAAGLEPDPLLPAARRGRSGRDGPQHRAARDQPEEGAS